jgi:hypothetical protein
MYENGTPAPDYNLNELKLDMGGVGGSGFDADGNFVMNISRMTSEGSFTDNLSIDAQDLMKSGKLSLAFSLTEGTQTHPFIFEIKPNGDIVVDKGNELFEILARKNAEGSADFLGRFAEVVQTVGERSDGSIDVMTLATFEGGGNDAILDTIFTNHEVVTNILHIPLDTDPPMFIPLFFHKPIEDVKNQVGNKEDIPPNKDNPFGSIYKTEAEKIKQKGQREGIQKEKESVHALNTRFLEDHALIRNSQISICEVKNSEALSKADFRGVPTSLRIETGEEMNLRNYVTDEERSLGKVEEIYSENGKYYFKAGGKLYQILPGGVLPEYELEAQKERRKNEQRERQKRNGNSESYKISKKQREGFEKEYKELRNTRGVIIDSEEREKIYKPDNYKGREVYLEKVRLDLNGNDTAKERLLKYIEKVDTQEDSLDAKGSAQRLDCRATLGWESCLVKSSTSKFWKSRRISDIPKPNRRIWRDRTAVV